MRGGWIRIGAVGLAIGGLVGSFGAEGRAEDPPSSSRLGRFFRRGFVRQEAKPPASTRPTPKPRGDDADVFGAPKPLEGDAGYVPPKPLSLEPYTSPRRVGGATAAPPANLGPAATPPATFNPPATPAPPPGANAGPRLVPQPRVSRAITEADPLVCRVALGRSDDGKTFAMFLEVFADGTVLDTEGVHRVGSDVLRPLVQVIQGADFARLRGHCGGPPTDFIEQNHVVVYDRYLGRLRANAFSYSGNPQGCDASVRQLQAALDAIQNKISGVAPTAHAAAEPPASEAPPIPLTPAN